MQYKKQSSLLNIWFCQVIPVLVILLAAVLNISIVFTGFKLKVNIYLYEQTVQRIINCNVLFLLFLMTCDYKTCHALFEMSLNNVHLIIKCLAI